MNTKQEIRIKIDLKSQKTQRATFENQCEAKKTCIDNLNFITDKGIVYFAQSLVTF